MLRNAAAAVVGVFALVASGSDVLAAPHTITCRNTASGASWTIVADPQKLSVDSFPAEFTSGAIRWKDARDSGTYVLDLATGVLTVTFASSTGGYSLRHRCALGSLRL